MSGGGGARAGVSFIIIFQRLSCLAQLGGGVLVLVLLQTKK